MEWMLEMSKPTRNETLLRKMRKGEEGHVKELLARHEYECGKLYHLEREKEISLDHWRESFGSVSPIDGTADSKVVVLVAEKHEELVGCAYLLVARYHLFHEVFIIEFHVEPQYRREVSEKLVQEIKRYCLEEEHIGLISVISEKLYVDSFIQEGFSKLKHFEYVMYIADWAKPQP